MPLQIKGLISRSIKPDPKGKQTNQKENVTRQSKNQKISRKNKKKLIRLIFGSMSFKLIMQYHDRKNKENEYPRFS